MKNLMLSAVDAVLFSTFPTNLQSTEFKIYTMSDAKIFLMCNAEVYFGKQECGPYSVLNKPEHNVNRSVILQEQTGTSLLVTGILVIL